MAKPSRPTSRANADIPQSTFIIDNGADSLEVGFAPNDGTDEETTLAACEVIPNYIVRSRERKTYIASGRDNITQWSEAVFRRPMEHGQIVNWEAQKEIWDYSIFDSKTASQKAFIEDPASTTLILAEQPNAMPALQKNTDEIVMEEWGFGGYLRTSGPALNAFNDLLPIYEDADISKGNARATVQPIECVLVIDSGYSNTHVVPCFEGRPISRAVRRLDFGGKHLTNLLKETISVRYFDLHQDTKIVNDIKEDVCFISRSLKSDLEKTWKGNKTTALSTTTSAMDIDQPSQDDDLRLDYVLPDGVNLNRGYARPHDPSRAAQKKRKLALSQPDANEITMTLGNERFTTPEILFSPADICSKQPGLAECVVQSLSKLPPLVQASMVAHILVVGGNANIPGFVERLQDELRSKIRSEWPVRVRKLGDPVTSTWLGGARLAANHRERVQRLAVSKDQYFEHGSQWLARRFAVP